MIMIWLEAEKTRSQRAKTISPGDAFRGDTGSGGGRPYPFSLWTSMEWR